MTSIWLQESGWSRELQRDHGKGEEQEYQDTPSCPSATGMTLQGSKFNINPGILRFQMP